MKRSGPPKRKTELRADPAKTREWQQRSRKRLPAKSAKQRDIDRERREVTRPAVVARDGERCWARDRVPSVRCASPFHDRPALEMHEVVPRSAWRMGAVDPSNCRLLCQAHHDWATDPIDPQAVIDAGLMAPTPTSPKILPRLAP